MNFTDAEAAKLSTREVLLGQPFASPHKMEKKGEGLNEAAIITGLAGATLALSAVVVGSWERIRKHEFPTIGVSMAKAGGVAATMAVGEYFAGRVISESADKIRFVKRDVARAFASAAYAARDANR